MAIVGSGPTIATGQRTRCVHATSRPKPDSKLIQVNAAGGGSVDNVN